MPTNQIRVLPVHAYPARKFARVARTFARVTRKKWILPPWELIFTTAEIDFYHHGKVIFTTVEIDFYHLGN